MSDKVTRPRGTQDFLPEKAELLFFINESATKFFQNYGYRPIVTPTFEKEELFKRSIGASTDIVQKEMYEFEDKAGRKMALRPEGTAPVVRAFIENNLQALPKPVKLYYIGQMFRYERPQAGRYREFWQMGAEAIGSSDPALDAEVIELCYGYLASLGIKDLVLKINSMGCRDCRGNYVEELKKFLSGKVSDFCKTCSQRIDINPLRVFDCKQESCQEALSDSPKILDYVCDKDKAHFERVRAFLDAVEINYTLDPHLVRGFDYYTKTTFEVLLPTLGAQNALSGGGRYDYLISDYGGPQEPAIGFAFGTERIMLALESQNISVFTRPDLDTFVVWLEEEQKTQAYKTTSYLRDKHLNVLMGLDGKSMKAQLKMADKLQARTALIIGEDEVKANLLTLKDLETGEQEKLSLEQTVDKLREKS